MQINHRANLVELLEAGGGLVAEWLRGLNGFPRSVNSPFASEIIGNGTIARCVCTQKFRGFACNAPRSTVKRGIVVGLAGLNSSIEGNRGQPARIDLRMKCQASS